MKLSGKVYDLLKWLALVCVPALATAYAGFAGVFGWGCADEVARCANVACTLLGALLGVSSAQYYKAEGRRHE